MQCGFHLLAVTEMLVGVIILCKVENLNSPNLAITTWWADSKEPTKNVASGLLCLLKWSQREIEQMFRSGHPNM